MRSQESENLGFNFLTEQWKHSITLCPSLSRAESMVTSSRKWRYTWKQSTMITLWSWAVSHFRYGTIVIAILIFKIMIYVHVSWENVWKSRNICILNTVHKKQILGVDCVNVYMYYQTDMYMVYIQIYDWYMYRCQSWYIILQNI